MEFTTAPELLAACHGKLSRGPHRCFYCGAACGDSHSTAEFVKGSFTGLDGVACPGSQFICPGCVVALNESAIITLPDGESRVGQKTRCYSWLITNGGATAATKAHLDWLRSLCLNPPAPPFALILSDSGQRQLIYRGLCSNERESVVVSLEDERIYYRPAELVERMNLAMRIAAATGKPALTERLTPSSAMRIVAHFSGDDSHVLEWQRVWEQPLSRLAAWLCPGKDGCLDKYPAAERVGRSKAPGATGHTSLQGAFGWAD